MKRFLLCIGVGLMGCAALAKPVEARGYIGVGVGCCGYYGGGYYGRPYYAYDPYYSPYYYGYPGYYAPGPTVVYSEPSPTTYIVQQPPGQSPVVSNQTPSSQTGPSDLAPPSNVASAPAVSEDNATFTDKKGRTCRKFVTSIDGSPVKGTACLRPDGTWHSVEE